MTLLFAPVLFLWLLQFVASTSIPSLFDATVDDLRNGLAQGTFTSVDLVHAYNARIQEVNPSLRVINELNPDALAIAKSLDEERKCGKVRGPLHGLPVLIKDNMATFDKMNNTAGSLGLLGAKVPRDATVVAKLRQAGAIILGKANMSQWASFRSFNVSQGWSAVGGQCLAAYLPDQDPSGSSSGSGVASSLGLAVATIGTDTHGSILMPGNANNVVGIRPTVGLTSRDLVIPISETQDTIGPLARTVKDAAYFLQAIVGVDSNDNATAANPYANSPPDYVAACKAGSLKGKRFGIPRNVLEELYQPSYLNNSAPIMKAFDEAVALIKAQGATIVDNANFTALAQIYQAPAEVGDAELTVLDSDFVYDLAKYLSQLTTNPNNLKTLQDVRNYTIHTPGEMYPEADVKLWDMALALDYDRTDARADQARKQNAANGGEGGVVGAIQRNKLDAVLLPTQIAYRFSAVAQTPAITVPLGVFPNGTKVVKNLPGTLVDVGPNFPFGIAFMGVKWSEASLISYAYSFEQLTHVRDKIHPYIKPKSEIRPSSSYQGPAQGSQ